MDGDGIGGAALMFGTRDVTFVTQPVVVMECFTSCTDDERKELGWGMALMIYSCVAVNLQDDKHK